MEPNTFREIEQYQRVLFKAVDRRDISANEACSQMFGTLATFVAFWMPEPAEREMHMHAMEMLFRETVYKMLRERESMH